MEGDVPSRLARDILSRLPLLSHSLRGDDVPKLLTSEQHQRFLSEGFVFPVRVFSAAEAERYRSACAELEVRLGGKPRTVEVRQMHLHFAWAHQLATHARVLDAVEDLLGPNLIIWATELFTKHPRDAVVSIAWHRDGAYMGLDPERTVTAWIALTGSGPANGGMRVVQESNRKKYLHLKADQKEVSGRRLPREPADNIIDVELQPGEMSLHDVHVLHGSGPNLSAQKRVGFAVRFTTPESAPALDHPPAILARGEDRYGHFELVEPPVDDDPAHALSQMRSSARRHLEATLRNLKHALH
jgi:non-heme Fe2+,alpha-ketoglutarate-dependent halogenase